VARNQRARLYGGMIESVARRGYYATTVADVIGLAGVSRRAFYEHFGDKDDCLLATHNSIVARARMQVIQGWASQRGWANRLHASCGSLFDDILRHPKGAQLVLVDSVGIAPGACERIRLTNLVFERLLHAALRAGSDSANLPRLAPCAIVGGVRHALFARVQGHREPELSTLADEVLDWVESYRSPREYRIAFSPDPVNSVPQTHASFLTQEDPRTRILSAMIRLIRELGYANFTDSQLARSARLPTQALHKHFPSKEVCFFTAIDAFATETLESAQLQMRDTGSWPTNVHRAMTAYIHYLTSHQELMQLAFLELFDIGPAIAGQMTWPVERLSTLLTNIGPSPQRVSPVVREAITGAIWAIIFSHATSDRVSRLPTLIDQLTFIVLAPHIGARAAADEILAARHE